MEIGLNYLDISSAWRCTGTEEFLGCDHVEVVGRGMRHMDGKTGREDNFDDVGNSALG